MPSWQVQDAKARFSEFLETALKEGPQIVTRRGVETAVVLSIEEYRRLKQASGPGLKDFLVGPGPRFEDIVPVRGGLRFRRPPKFK